LENDDILYSSALELRKLYEARTLSPVEVVEAIFERAEQVEPVLNGLVTPTWDLAREQAREAEAAYASGPAPADKPLLGIPLTVKDTLPTKGIRSTNGVKLLKDAVPEVNASSVGRSLAAGAVMLGKTNTPEFGWKGETSNLLFGTTRNPWDPSLTPGGSSGGAASCLAAGLGPIALGTDGGGSSRIPAAFTGVFGLKCTFGLVAAAPNGPLETVPHVGLMSRQVRDSALLLATVAGVDPRDRLSQNSAPVDWLAETEKGVKGLRIAWSADLGFAPIEDEIAGLTREAAFAFQEAGATVEEVELDFTDPHDICYSMFAIANAGMYRDNWDEVRELIDPGRAVMVELGFSLSGGDIGKLLIQRAQWTEKMVRFMESYDLLVTPAMPITAFAAGLDHPATVNGTPTPGFRWSPFTYGANVTGQPAASVPCGLASNGLPIGIQLLGRRHEDATVLRAAAAFEAIKPWRDVRPPLAAITSFQERG
jgi:aspartyl-tRNA(Asn)/glutamyl-tRNA(Gln) amidotransferase subunit A